jgi:outer membrane biosynthesis protein TonB
MNLTYNNIRNISYSSSIVFHILLLLLALLINFALDSKAREFIELSFGEGGFGNSGGSQGIAMEESGGSTLTEETVIQKTENKVPEVKEVELPTSKTTSTDNIINPVDKTKEIKKEKTEEKTDQGNSNTKGTGQGSMGQGEGGAGFDIQWGGNGTRKIYSYIIPDYPEGVNKEIDIRLKFTIKPDGTVGSIFLLTKADTRLENAAINSLWQWRFEPLSANQGQGDQSAIIVFPYRLQ